MGGVGIICNAISNIMRHLKWHTAAELYTTILNNKTESRQEWVNRTQNNFKINFRSIININNAKTKNNI